MKTRWRWRGRTLVLGLALGLGPAPARAQIDPVERQLIQAGYNQPLEGRGPVSGYAFYYLNRPDFPHTNQTLRLAVAPVYLDAELGFRQLLGPNTDLALGCAGGGYADSYSEVRGGKLFREESFEGHGGEATVSLYHLLNPSQRIPLNLMLRGQARHSVYEGPSLNDGRFAVPGDRTTFTLRSGLRWGGREPLMSPAAAMELSCWHEAQFRLAADAYGYAGDRRVEAVTHSFLGRALLDYTLSEWQHYFAVSLTAGVSVHADRFSAYRVGGLLPLAGEFPLMLPGYYFQELSAERFGLLSVLYAVPVDHAHRWAVTGYASTAVVDYLKGLEQPGHWHSGVGGGISFRSANDVWELLLGYAYGIDAMRSGHRGSHAVNLLVQYNIQNAPPFRPQLNPLKWRGLDRLLRR